MLLPAVCSQCQSVFVPRAINVENATIHLEGVSVGPCPKCGGFGRIPDGVYSVIDNVLDVLRAPERSRADLERIAQIFRKASEEKHSRAQVAATIRRDAPSVSKIADVLPQDRSDFYAVLQILIGIVGLYLALKSPSPNITVNQVINQITIEAQRTPSPSVPERDVSPKQGKFKKEKRRLKKGERQERRRE